MNISYYEMNYLDFVNSRRQLKIDLAILNEAFETKKIETVLSLIEDILRKHLDGTLVPLVGFVDVKIGEDSYKAKEYIVVDSKMHSQLFTFNWKVNEKSSEIYSISFFKDIDFLATGEGIPAATILTLGKSIVKILPLIWESINNNDFSFNDDFVRDKSKILDTKAKESKYDAYYERYKILENLSKEDAENMFREADETDDAYSKLKSKKEEIEKAKANKGTEKDLIAKLFGEYSNLVDNVYKSFYLL